MTVHDSPPDDHQQPGLSKDPDVKRHRRAAKSATVGGAALAILLTVYAVARPILNERFGLQLPDVQHLAQNDDSTVAEKVEENPEVKTGTGPLVNSRSKEPTAPTKTPTAGSPADVSLLYGILSDQGNNRFLSPAGLLYVPGSQEGHRLKHVERHIADDPGRPGSHGVFDGGMADALVTIDKAYRKAQTGTQTSKQEEGGRTIYTVDMGGRVGYVGGRDGRRRKNPMARRVRLVLERNRVITAYPM